MYFFDWQSFYDRTISFESSGENTSSLNFFVNLVMPSALAKEKYFFDWQSFYDRTISFESSGENTSSLNFFVNLVMPSALAKEKKFNPINTDALIPLT